MGDGDDPKGGDGDKGDGEKFTDDERDELKGLIREVVDEVLPELLKGDDDAKGDDDEGAAATKGDLKRASDEMAAAMAKLAKGDGKSTTKAKAETEPTKPKSRLHELVTKSLWGGDE